MCGVAMPMYGYAYGETTDIYATCHMRDPRPRERESARDRGAGGRGAGQKAPGVLDGPVTAPGAQSLTLSIKCKLCTTGASMVALYNSSCAA